jgi:hypothetical protein
VAPSKSSKRSLHNIIMIEIFLEIRLKHGLYILWRMYTPNIQTNRYKGSTQTAAIDMALPCSMDTPTHNLKIRWQGATTGAYTLVQPNDKQESNLWVFLTYSSQTCWKFLRQSSPSFDFPTKSRSSSPL